MRAVTLIVLLCTLSSIASAQTAKQCPPTARAGDLLNCYNWVAPSHTVGKPKPSDAQTAADKAKSTSALFAVDKPSKARTEKTPYVDMFVIENKKLDAKLKTLCRGC